MKQRFKIIFRNFLLKYITPEIIAVPNSFSQAGEDMVLNFLFTGVGLKTIKYLELGVFSPDNCSNTYKYYLEGSRGVLVEADITQIDSIRAKRPKDIILNVGVGLSNEKEADFYVFNNQGLNTFDKDEARFRNDYGSFKIQNIVKVPLKTITEIINENFETFPEFLSIDIEGLDLDVLKSINFMIHPIPVICAETCTYSENHIKQKDKSIEKYLTVNGYFVYADTYINTIFVNENWFNSVNNK